MPYDPKRVAMIIPYADIDKIEYLRYLKNPICDADLGCVVVMG